MSAPAVARVGTVGALASVLTLMAVVSRAATEARPFTVPDSIAIERFTNPDPDQKEQVPLFSPDGRYFAVVTQRGELQSDTLRSTLWLFDASAVRRQLSARGSDVDRPAPPRPLAILSGRTATPDNNDGLTTLRSLRWSQDGRNLLFLGREGSADWHLFSVAPADGVLHMLTPADQNVGCYEQRGDLIVYAVAPHRSTAPLPAATVATGRSIASLLFPDEDSSDLGNQEDLWLLRAGKATPLIDPRSRTAVHLRYYVYDPASALLSLSPDGNTAIITTAATAIPQTWPEYEPGYPTWRIKLADPEVLKYQGLVPERFVIVDLRTGESAYAVDAPLGRSAGWSRGPTQVIWEGDSRRAILVNTFLPLDATTAAARAHRTQNPLIVEYDVATHAVTEIAPVRESSGAQIQRWGIAAVDWQADAGELSIRYTSDGPAPERYRRKGGHWMRVQGAHSAAARSRSSPLTALHVTVQQDLNTPPAVFASLGETSPPRKIWDPNPQLRNTAFGVARIYDWTDRHGRKVQGVLFLPAGYEPGKRYPLVIEARDYFQDRFVIDGTYTTAVAARAMAASGLMVLQAGEPHLPRDAFFSQELEASVEGYATGIAKLQADGLIDPERVGIIAFSRTCSNVLYALTKQPALFAAATLANGIVYGYSQYLYYLDFDANNMGGGQYRAVYGGPPFGPYLPAYLRENPVFNLDKVQAAVRIETHTPANLLFDWETYGGLRTLDKPVDLIMLPYATHVVSMPSDLLQSQQGDVEWFRFWLQGHEEPDADHAAQYRRWETLCDQQRAQSTARPTYCVRTHS